MSWNVSASLALLYLILYAILLIFLLALYITRSVSIRSRYTIITFHILIRLASQGVGLAFDLVGYSNVSLLVAYFILGAEGYFTLVLCSYRFLIAWHNAHFTSGDSWLEPKRPKGLPLRRRIINAFRIITARGEKPRPMSIIHNLLVGANTVIVTGGSLLAGGNNDTSQFNTEQGTVNTAKILRTVGQAIFLAINIFLMFSIIHTIYQERKERTEREGFVHTFPHPTIILLVIAWPLLIIRGLYGLLNSFINPFNYFYPGNYTADGLSRQFIAYEYVLGTTMEWASCALLVATWFTERWWPGMNDEYGNAISADNMGKEQVVTKG